MGVKGINDIFETTMAGPLAIWVDIELMRVGTEAEDKLRG